MIAKTLDTNEQKPYTLKTTKKEIRRIQKAEKKKDVPATACGGIIPGGGMAPGGGAIPGGGACPNSSSGINTVPGARPAGSASSGTTFAPGGKFGT